MDERFAKVRTDPRFKKPAKNERKVKIDKRFQQMFKDDRFREKYTVDKLGRSSTQFSSNKDLERYYDLSSSSEDVSSDGDDKTEVSGPVAKEGTGPPVGVDLSRGEGNVGSSSSSSENEDSESDIIDSEESSNDEFEHKWAELDAEAPREDKSTSRLALCNMDWDRVKPSDLYLLFNSFKPVGSVIKSVKIYTSDYGVQRLKEEEICGPHELTNQTPNDRKIAKQFEDEDQYCTEKLRQYQLNRMRYYYSVIDCDSSDTASTIYTHCNDMEYESSSNKLDLRFIPDDMTFSDRSPVSECTTLPTSAPTDYHTTALHQTKVQLTWDETNPDRVKKTSKNYKTLEEIDEDLNAYLASSTSESSEEDSSQIQLEGKDTIPALDDDNDNIDKYKSLITSIESVDQSRYDKQMEMEVTWEPGLKETTEEIVHSKDTQTKNTTPWEKFIEKKKMKKKERKLVKTKLDTKKSADLSEDSDKSESDEDDQISNKKRKLKKKLNKGKVDSDDEKERENLSLLLMDDDDEGKKEHFNLQSLIANEKESGKKKRNKRKREQKKSDLVEDDFTINTDDSRFTALFETPEYAIDPSNPQFKKTDAMTTILNERQKRRKINKNQQQKIQTMTASTNNQTNNISDSLTLMKCIKSRAGLYQKKKK